jgi:hypothetical protein
MTLEPPHPRTQEYATAGDFALRLIGRIFRYCCRIFVDNQRAETMLGIGQCLISGEPWKNFAPFEYCAA